MFTIIEDMRCGRMKASTPIIIMLAFILSLGVYGIICQPEKVYNHTTGVKVISNAAYTFEADFVVGDGLEYRKCFDTHVTYRKNMRCFHRAKRTEHLVYWRVLHGDKLVYSEELDHRLVNGNTVIFLYVVDE